MSDVEGWDLDPSIAHLNHGSFGAVPRAVAEAQQRWKARIEANPNSFFGRDVDGLIDAAREQVSQHLRCDAEGFAFVPNVTFAANAVMGSLAFEPGDRILMTDHAYGAVLMTAQKAALEQDASVDVVPVPLGATDVCERILAAAGPRTRLAIIDHVTSPTATIFPIEDIVKALKRRGVAVFVDAAHAPGMVPVDVASLAPDFWACNFHKWICAPRASGGLWVSEEHRSKIRPLVVSWRAGEGYPGSFGWWGTADFSPYLATPDAFDFIGAFDTGPDDWRRLTIEGAELVRESAGLEQVPGRDGSQIGCMQILQLPDGTAPTRDAARALSARIAAGLGVEVAVAAWGPGGLLRLSAHAYNTLEDFERLAVGLGRAAMRRSLNRP